MKKYLLAGLVLLAGAAWLYPDDDAAAIYIKKAQDLAKKKEYKEALANFNKAINEAPELVPAYLALGELYRDLNESLEATANFRKALDLIAQQGSPDKFKSVQAKINAYLAEYDKNRQEANRCREQFVQSLWSLIEKYENEDAPFALLVVERALKIAPASVTFSDKRLELARKISEQGKEQMTPLFNGTDLDGWKGSHEDWQVQDQSIRFECDKPEILSGLSQKIKFEGDYTLSAKVRLDRSNSGGHFLMLSFGYQTLSDNYAFGLFDRILVIARHEGEQPYRDIRRTELPAGVELADWNELTVEVFGNSVRCYLNGELCLELEEPDKAKLHGLMALVGNNCAGAFKDIRYSSEE